MWGAVLIGMGFVDDFPQLAGLRSLLGLFEAGFFPSCVYLLSTWYTRCMSLYRCVAVIQLTGAR